MTNEDSDEMAEETGSLNAVPARTHRWPRTDTALTAVLTALAVAAVGSLWKHREDEKVWRADCQIAQKQLDAVETRFTDTTFDLADVRGPMTWGSAGDSAELQDLSDRIDEAIARGEELRYAGPACASADSAEAVRAHSAEVDAVITEITTARAEFALEYQMFDTHRAATVYAEASTRILDALLRAQELHDETAAHPDQDLRDHFAGKIELAREVLAEPIGGEGAESLYVRATDLNMRSRDLAITAVQLTDDTYWADLRDQIEAL